MVIDFFKVILQVLTSLLFLEAEAGVALDAVSIRHHGVEVKVDHEPEGDRES